MVVDCDGACVKALWAPWRMHYLQPEAKKGTAQECLFCCFEPGGKVTGDLDAELLVSLGELAWVMMNKYPYSNGHVMIGPRRHVGSFADLSGAEITAIGDLTRKALQVLTQMCAPDGFNIGYNQGTAAGAGIADHLHCHVVPRWHGDHNFMPVLADVRVIPEHLLATASRFRKIWEEIA